MTGRPMKAIAALGLGAIAITAAAGTAVFSQTGGGDPSLVARGQYLAEASDCGGCHSRKGDQPFSGGQALTTTLGTLYAANITPDDQTGIGSWSADQFYRALHLGRDAHGRHLYPAMPYNYYTGMTRADSDAIYAYLRTVPAVSYTPPPNKLPPPLQIRAIMGVWNALYFHPGEYRPDPARSADWNRGAYLVETLGHCGGCHTPMNLLGAPKTHQYLQGGMIEDWFATDLTADRRKGLGGWSRQDLVDYLRTGRNAHAAAAGPMGEVVAASTSHLTDADLNAIGAYLSERPASASTPAPAIDPATMRQGEAIYVDNCSACHQMQGQGAPGFFPPLQDHAGLQQSNPSTTIRVILTGVQSTPTAAKPTGVAMPAYAWKLTDRQVAAVATYVRNAWSNSAPSVTSGEVSKLRRKLVSENQPPRAPTTRPMTRPAPDTLASPGSDSRDNGTPDAGRPASES